MKTFDSRVDFLHILPKGLRICEIGVFMGDFSQQILDICEPKLLVLIDTFSGTISSGDENGNNLRTFNGKQLYESVYDRFKNYNNVKIHKDRSSKILEYRDEFFDMIYIDAEHSYHACKEDLENCYEKVKGGGLLGGHDYNLNMEKTQNPQYYASFGVRSAVNEFCINYNKTVNYECLDGYTSFFIDKAV
jgi:hypothetical protein